MDDIEKEAIIELDKANGVIFDTILEQINNENKEYFNSRKDRYTDIKDCFALLTNWMPPYYRLRYIAQSKLDETIKARVINEYKKLFGAYADFQEILN
jgi:hypothetical protein